jgi:hypothetical protein
MPAYDVSAGHISDYTAEAYCRACFMEAFALAVTEKPRGAAFPGLEAWMGFFYVAQDYTALLKAINERAQRET